VSSKHIVGSNGPFGESKSQFRYPIHYVLKKFMRIGSTYFVLGPLNGASLKDHDLRDEYNCQQARLSQPSSSGTRAYTSVRRNPPLLELVQRQLIYSRRNLSILFPTRCVVRGTVSNHFLEKRFKLSVSGFITKQPSNSATI